MSLLLLSAYCLALYFLVLIEYARNVLKMPNANSTEVDPECTHKVITGFTTALSCLSTVLSLLFVF